MSCGACPGIIDVKCDCKSFANKEQIYPWFDIDPSMGGGFFDHECDTSHRLVVRASSSYFGVAVRVFFFVFDRSSWFAEVEETPGCYEWWQSTEKNIAPGMNTCISTQNVAFQLRCVFSTYCITYCICRMIRFSI